MPDCATCKDNRKTIPAIVHEADMERQQQDKKRLWIVIIILIAALILTNGAWVYYESQFVTEEVSQEVDTGRGNAYVVGIGDFEYGTSTANDAPEDAQNGR